VPQSAEAIASALLRLMADPAAARAMGERGRVLARTRYSWDSIARAMADRYEAVAARSGLVAVP
jgi:glycosyltransferase involved in cell wall biosynthesis